MTQVANTELEVAGVQELIISFFPRTDPQQLRRFASEFLIS